MQQASNGDSRGAAGEPLLSNGERTNSRPDSKHQRLASLDIVRGFTVALMIFVDDVSSPLYQTRLLPSPATSAAADCRPSSPSVCLLIVILS